MTRIAALLLSLTAAALATACSRTPAASATDIKVDQTGFVPKEFNVPAGQEVTLRVTRTTDQTCAKEIVIKDQGINQPLPLNQPVEVKFTPKAKGDLRFACSMDHIAGTIHVQ